MSYQPPEGFGDLRSDVWGIPQRSLRKSLFSDLFTHGVSGVRWWSSAAGNTSIASRDGALVLNSGDTNGEIAKLSSKRRARYQPNRGVHYATAAMGFDAVNKHKVRWGLVTSKYGAFFEWRVTDEGAKLYAVLRRTTGVVAPGPEDHTTGYGAATTADDAVEIDLTGLGIDVTKNALFDIRFQWRGAGNFFFYVNQQLVHTFERLGAESSLSLGAPALPCLFEIENVDGDTAEVVFGCVDLTSEGGDDPFDGYVPRPQSGANAAVPNSETEVLLIRLGNYLAGIQNTRDAILYRLECTADAFTYVRVYIVPSGDVDSTWTIPDADSAIEVSNVITSVTYTNARKIAERRFNNFTSVAFDQTAIRHFLHDDMAEYGGQSDVLVITAEKDTGGTADFAVTVDVGENT